MKILIFAVTLVVAQAANAQQVFEVQWQNSLSFNPPGNPCDGSSGSEFIDQAATGSPTITLSTSNAFAFCTRRIRIFPDDSFATLKRLSIQPGSPLEPFLIVIGASLNPNPNATPSKFEANWNGMTVGSAPNGTVFYGGITGNLLGTIGGVNKIARFDCDGTIFGNIFTTECIRRAANTLLRAAKDANGGAEFHSASDLGAAASQPPAQAQPDASHGGAEFHSANRAQPDAPDLGAESFQPSDRAQPDALDSGADAHSATTPVPCSSSSKSTLSEHPDKRDPS